MVHEHRQPAPVHRHALEHLGRWGRQQWVGQYEGALVCHALHGLLQLRMVGGALQATFWGLQAQPIEVIQRTNSVHPSKSP